MLKNLKMLFLMLCTLLISPAIVEASKQDNISSNSQLTFGVEGDLSVGEIITLTVNTQGIKELYGASLDFKFDSNQVEVLDLSGGDLLSEQFITPVNQINKNSASIVITELGNKVNMISDGVLFKVKLKLLKAGELVLTPTSSNSDYKVGNANMLIKLSNKNALPIDYEATEMSYNISEDNALAFDEIKVDKVSPQEVGSTIIITPEVNGGTGNLQYKYWIYADGKWTVVKDFSSATSYDWKPEKAGDYKIWVDVKDSSGTMVSKEISYTITEKALALTNIKVDKVSPQGVGSTITITPEVSGGTGNLQYKYWIYADGKWTVVKDFSSATSYDWKPEKAGNYKIWVDVKDSSGTMVSKEIIYVVKD